MPSFLSNRRLIVLLVCIISAVVIIGLTMKERPYPSWPEQFIRDSIGFVQTLMYKPARTVAGFFESVQEMRVMYTENQRLKASLQDHALLVARIQELEAENRSLRSLIEVEESLGDYQLRAAEVIMRSPDRWYQQVTINRGSKHGIEANMAVITSDGLVGRVKSVAQFTAVVELLSDSNREINVSAVVQGEELIFGTIEGYDDDYNALLFSKIRMDAPLEVGQQVITNGLGGVFPRGLYIGEVIDVIPDQYGLTQMALVKPAADFNQVDFVYVVERSSLSPLEPEEDEEQEEGGGE